MKYFVSTGFDIHAGFLNYKQFFLYNDNTSLSAATASKTTDSTPLYQKITIGTHNSWSITTVLKKYI
jgi:hypothetical protein